MHRPRLALWPTVFLIPALALLITLGIWQLQRLDEKTALITRIESGLAADPAPLPRSIVDPEAWDYRRVTLDGTFLHDRELYLVGRTRRGQPGLHVVTPLRRDGPGSQAILVNRGWVPLDRRDRATRSEGLPAGPQTLSGIARLPPERGWMQPDNDPQANEWYWLDIPAMAEAAATGPVPVLIVEAEAVGEALPIGGQTRLDIPNNHLQYAITWFSFAVVLLVIYVLYHRRPIDHGPSDGPEPT